MNIPVKILNFLVNGLLTVLEVFGVDSPNRIVIALSPLFVAAAGWVCTEVASLLPGLPALNQWEVMGVFIAGATFATGKILLWLHGWQLHEQLLGVPVPPRT